jgi:CHAT domain-containing protein
VQVTVQLLDKKGKELSGKFSISYISTGRDIVRLDTPIREYESAAIIADPKYELTGEDSPETDDINSNNDRGIYSEKERENFKYLFKALPFTRVEASALAGIFKGKKIIRFQAEARKNTLSEISKYASPEIIHISTHGFYLTKEEENSLPNQKTNDPLSRCGLVFSGVNNWLESDGTKFLKDYGDGILTARDVLSLDLPKTDLLVLSACQTALGDIKNGDGIKGLRRSFEIAGVKSIICTLWSVDDLSSAILIEQFYKNLFNSKMDKLQALSNAKDYVKKLTQYQLYDYCLKNETPKEVMDRVEESQHYASELHPFEHPYYWAGFILQGNISTPK